MKRHSLAIGLLAAAAVTALAAGCSSSGGGGSSPSSSPSSSGSPSSSASNSAPSSSAGASSGSAAPAQGEIDQQLQQHPIKFALNKADLDANSRQTLKTIGGLLDENKDTKVKVTGYVVPHSLPAAQEKSLSTQRAESVATALEKDGVAKNRITAEGGGAGQSGASAKVQVTG